MQKLFFFLILKQVMNILKSKKYLQFINIILTIYTVDVILGV